MAKRMAQIPAVDRRLYSISLLRLHIFLIQNFRNGCIVSFSPIFIDLSFHHPLSPVDWPQNEQSKKRGLLLFKKGGKRRMWKEGRKERKVLNWHEGRKDNWMGMVLKKWEESGKYGKNEKGWEIFKETKRAPEGYMAILHHIFVVQRKEPPIEKERWLAAKFWKMESSKPKEDWAKWKNLEKGIGCVEYWAKMCIWN
jgi:hypothetical protein